MMNFPTTRKLANELGLNKYFTGEPCKHGHIAPRYTDSGTCQECIRQNVANSHNRNHDVRENRRAAFEQLVATPVRVSAENYRRVRDLAFNLTRIRFPHVTIEDVARKLGGKDAQGGLLLYTLHMHSEDVAVVRAYADSLIPRTVDVAAVRNRIFGSVLKLADDRACAQPEFRP